MELVDIELRNIVKEGEQAKCYTYSNLIASYLNVHFDNKTKHVHCLNHGWVSSDDFVHDYIYPFNRHQKRLNGQYLFKHFCLLDWG